MDNTFYCSPWLVDVEKENMIETIIQQLIEELGATGVLVVGLYYFLFRPLNSMSKHIKVINHELGELVEIAKELQKEK